MYQIGPHLVRINKCSISRGWYHRRVGQIVSCEFFDEEGFWAREGGIYNPINKILREDVTLLDATFDEFKDEIREQLYGPLGQMSLPLEF